MEGLGSFFVKAESFERFVMIRHWARCRTLICNLVQPSPLYTVTPPSLLLPSPLSLRLPFLLFIFVYSILHSFTLMPFRQFLNSFSCSSCPLSLSPFPSTVSLLYSLSLLYIPCLPSIFPVSLPFSKSPFSVSCLPSLSLSPFPFTVSLPFHCLSSLPQVSLLYSLSPFLFPRLVSLHFPCLP
jgi:hypothetical protein